MTNIFWKKALSTFAIFTGILVSCSALAQEDDTQLLDNAEALATDAKYYSAIYGVSETEALRRLLIMHGSQEEIEALQSEYDGKLAGLYFDNGPEFSVNLLLTDDQVPSDKKLIRKARKDERTAERKAQRQAASKEDRKAQRNSKFPVTDAEVDQAIALIEQPTEIKVKFKGKAKDTKKNQLRKLEQKSGQLIEKIVGFMGIAYSEREGSFVLDVNKSMSENAGLTTEKITEIATKTLGSSVRVNLVDGVTTDQAFRGGSSLKKADGVTSLCTSGFTVKDRTTGAIGIVTAGHCDSAVITYTDKDGSRFQMNRVKRQMNAKNDMAFYTASGQVGSPTFYPDSGSVPRKLVGWTSVSQTEKSSFLKEGSFVCTYGQTTAQQSCGEVTSLEFIPDPYKNGQRVGCGAEGATFISCGPNFVKVEPKVKAGQPYLRCEGGDSGGPWFAYGNAYGIHKGGSVRNGNCDYAYYTPIIRINDLDLTLYYGN